MRKFQIKPSGEPIVPWVEPCELSDFNTLEDFEAYLDEQADAYEEIGAKLRPGEPHFMSKRYQWGEEDEKYLSDRRIFEQREALRQHEEANAPPPSMTIPKEQKALLAGGNDAAEAQKRLEVAGIVNEHLQSAIDHEAQGHTRRARDSRQRAAQWERELKKMEKVRYEFEDREESEALDYGEAQLDEMINWTGPELAEAFDKVKALAVGHRQISPSEYSYIITGEGNSLKLSKIRHPSIPAHDLEARMGDIGDGNLLLKLGCHGVEAREDPEPEEVPAEPKAEPTRSSPADILVNPNIFGGIKQ